MGSTQNMNTRPKKKVPIRTDSVIETIRDVGGDIGKNTAKAVTDVATDALTSIFGGHIRTGELKPNQSIELPQGGEQRPTVAPQKREFISQLLRDDETKIKQQIDAVRQELKALAQSIRSLRQEVSKSIMETPVHPGIYHLNYFDHLRSFLHVLKEQVDDSRTWLSAFATCKKKKGYWGMYKKHGTTFGMSNERSIATSAG